MTREQRFGRHLSQHHKTLYTRTIARNFQCDRFSALYVQSLKQTSGGLKSKRGREIFNPEIWMGRVFIVLQSYECSNVQYLHKP